MRILVNDFVVLGDYLMSPMQGNLSLAQSVSSFIDKRADCDPRYPQAGYFER